MSWAICPQYRPLCVQDAHCTAHQAFPCQKYKPCALILPYTISGAKGNETPRSKLRGIRRKRRLSATQQAAGNRALQGIENSTVSIPATGDRSSRGCVPKQVLVIGSFLLRRMPMNTDDCRPWKIEFHAGLSETQCLC
jgi:hypothetical protein